MFQLYVATYAASDSLQKRQTDRQTDMSVHNLTAMLCIVNNKLAILSEVKLEVCFQFFFLVFQDVF